MFLNLTEETCTGTGNTLTLTGATTGRNAFGKTGNGTDGQLVSCVVDDADGITHVAGIYTFNKTANTLTRNDTWNDNGTAIDQNPLTNITLSGGTHTVRCDVTLKGLSITPLQPAKWQMTSSGFDTLDNWSNLSASFTVAANTCYYLGARLFRGRLITSLILKVDTADATATISKAGIYSVSSSSKPSDLLAEVSIDVSTTGIKVVALAASIYLPAGDYFLAFASDGVPAIMATALNSVMSTSYAITMSTPRMYHPSETLSSWTALPAVPNPTSFTQNYSPVVGWS